MHIESIPVNRPTASELIATAAPIDMTDQEALLRRIFDEHGQHSSEARLLRQLLDENVAGVAIIDSAANKAEAQIFIDYLLSQKAQEYFNRETNEYPLSATVETNSILTPLSEINVPDIDLSALEDLDGTLQLLTELGIL